MYVFISLFRFRGQGVLLDNGVVLPAQDMVCREVRIPGTIGSVDDEFGSETKENPC